LEKDLLQKIWGVRKAGGRHRKTANYGGPRGDGIYEGDLEET